MLLACLTPAICFLLLTLGSTATKNQEHHKSEQASNPHLILTSGFLVKRNENERPKIT
jgi:hypothetical protein